MKVAALSATEFAGRLRASGIYLRTGPFLTHIRSSLPNVADGITLLYADYLLEDHPGFADFHVSVSRPRNLRRWIRPQALLLFDGHMPFQPVPLAQAYAIFEWGLNWCISSYANQYLMFHAAVVEKDGCAAIMPGEPGAGKSTLCAALVNRGWRLLSDELALISLQDASVTAVSRPVSLKNESIDVIRRFAPQAIIGHACHDTAKGTVAHMRAPTDSVERSQERAVPSWIIFPKYVSGVPTCLQRETKSKAFMRLAVSSFNYSLLGMSGFNTVAELIDSCDCYDITYGNLDEAVTVFGVLGPPAESVLARAPA